MTKPLKPPSLTRADKLLAFVIPVRHPDDRKVTDYRAVEAVLRKTIDSVFSQHHTNFAVVVCAHRVPSWAAEYDGRLRFVDVTGCPRFIPNGDNRRDKGMKLIVGTLYALSTLDPSLVMLMDADDYVNTRLGAYLISRGDMDASFDGYLITRGAHAWIRFDERWRVSYEYAVTVRDFNRSSGSCRIFKPSVLKAMLQSIDGGIEQRFQPWPQAGEQRDVRVSETPLRWLWGTADSIPQSRDSVIELMARHVDQTQHFNLVPVEFLGAAKGCGHGNHQGPRGGAVHWDKAVKMMGMRSFLESFGLADQPWSLSQFRPIIEIARRSTGWKRFTRYAGFPYRVVRRLVSEPT
ncbi:MAG TPA: hypothetical protein VMO47_03010 [Rhodothermales bacterium]|nr:hypothetical protein [Rhodothermales bacterium]